MAYFCGECAQAFPIEEERAHHRYTKHSEMFPPEDGMCVFCGMDMVSYFQLHDHLQMMHCTEYAFLVAMGSRRNAVTTPRSPVYWLQVAYLLPSEQHLLDKVDEKMPLMWSKMEKLGVDENGKADQEVVDDRDDSTPPALLHLTNPQEDIGHEDPVDPEPTESDPSCSAAQTPATSSNESAAGSSDGSSSSRHDPVLQNYLPISAPVNFLFPVNLGTGRTAFMQTHSSPTHPPTASAPRPLSNEGSPTRPETNPPVLSPQQAMSNETTTSESSHKDTPDDDDEELEVIAHIRPPPKDPNMMMSPTLAGQLTPCQMAALMGRPIVPSGLSMEAMQAVLEQQMGGVGGISPLISPNNGSSGSSNGCSVSPAGSEGAMRGTRSSRSPIKSLNGMMKSMGSTGGPSPNKTGFTNGIAPSSLKSPGGSGTSGLMSPTSNGGSIDNGAIKIPNCSASMPTAFTTPSVTFSGSKKDSSPSKGCNAPSKIPRIIPAIGSALTSPIAVAGVINGSHRSSSTGSILDLACASILDDVDEPGPCTLNQYGGAPSTASSVAQPLTESRASVISAVSASPIIQSGAAGASDPIASGPSVDADQPGAVPSVGGEASISHVPSIVISQPAGGAPVDDISNGPSQPISKPGDGAVQGATPVSIPSGANMVDLVYADAVRKNRKRDPRAPIKFSYDPVNKTLGPENADIVLDVVKRLVATGKEVNEAIAEVMAAIQAGAAAEAASAASTGTPETAVTGDGTAVTNASTSTAPSTSAGLASTPASTVPSNPATNAAVTTVAAALSSPSVIATTASIAPGSGSAFRSPSANGAIPSSPLSIALAMSKNGTGTMLPNPVSTANVAMVKNSMNSGITSENTPSFVTALMSKRSGPVIPISSGGSASGNHIRAGNLISTGGSAFTKTMASIIGECSKTMQEPVFKVPQLPREKLSAPTSRKRISLADEARKYFPAPKMAKMNAETKRKVEAMQQPNQRGLTNHSRLSIIITTLLGIDNRKDRQDCQQMEREFTAYMEYDLGSPLPEDNESLRMQLILAFAVLRSVLEKPLTVRDPMFSLEDQRDAARVAGSLWVFVPVLAKEPSLVTLARLQANIALVMAQCPRVRLSLNQLHIALEAATVQARLEASIIHLSRMLHDVEFLNAFALGIPETDENGQPVDRIRVIFHRVFETLFHSSSRRADAYTDHLLHLLQQAAPAQPKIPDPDPHKLRYARESLLKRLMSCPRAPPHSPVESEDEQEEDESLPASASPASVDSASPGRLVIVEDEEEDQPGPSNVSYLASSVFNPPVEQSQEPVLKKFVSLFEAKTLYGEDKRIWLNNDTPISCRYNCDMMATTSGMVSHYRRYHYDVYYLTVHKTWEENSINRWLATRFGNVKTGTKEKRACVACRLGKAEYNDRMHLAQHFKVAHPKYFEELRGDYFHHFNGDIYDDPVIEFLLKV